MNQIELADTLIALVEGIEAPPGTGLFVTEAELEVPMEVSGVLINNSMVFFAAPPHTRWKSGVLPQVHRAVLRVELAEDDNASVAGSQT
jgi:hypothetical protein